MRDEVAIARMSTDELEREILEYLYTSGEGDEEYKFNIKMHYGRLPDEISEKLTASRQEELLADTYREALLMFMDEVKQNYRWVSGWRQDGRSGGWLVITTNEPVLDHYGEIPLYESDKGGPKDWSPRSTSGARKRLKDLREIGREVRDAKSMLIHDMRSMDFWGDEKYWNRSA